MSAFPDSRTARTRSCGSRTSGAERFGGAAWGRRAGDRARRRSTRFAFLQNARRTRRSTRARPCPGPRPRSTRARARARPPRARVARAHQHARELLRVSNPSPSTSPLSKSSARGRESAASSALRLWRRGGEAPRGAGRTRARTRPVSGYGFCSRGSTTGTTGHRARRGRRSAETSRGADAASPRRGAPFDLAPPARRRRPRRKAPPPRTSRRRPRRTRTSSPSPRRRTRVRSRSPRRAARARRRGGSWRRPRRRRRRGTCAPRTPSPGTAGATAVTRACLRWSASSRCRSRRTRSRRRRAGASRTRVREARARARRRRRRAPPAATPPRRRRRRNRQKIHASASSRPTLDATDAGEVVQNAGVFFLRGGRRIRDAEGVSRVYTSIVGGRRVVGTSARGFFFFLPGRDAKEKPKRSAGSSDFHFGERRTLLESSRGLRRFGRPHARAHAERWETDLRGRSSARARVMVPSASASERYNACARGRMRGGEPSVRRRGG